MKNYPTKCEANYGLAVRQEANILGVKVSGNPREEVLRIIREKMDINTFIKPFFIVTANPEIIIEAQRDGEFKEILNLADLAVADGAGLRLAGAREIIPGRKLVAEILSGKPRTFYLGGRGGVAVEMAKRYGGVGDEGHSDIKSQITNHKSQINSKIIKKINEYKPDLLLVAYGAPWQEKWIAANKSRLKAKVVIGVGGTFDYLTGRAKVPPEWVNRAGLEWLWRLLHEPWRWRRQLKLVEFGWRVLTSNII